MVSVCPDVTIQVPGARSLGEGAGTGWFRQVGSPENHLDGVWWACTCLQCDRHLFVPVEVDPGAQEPLSPRSAVCAVSTSPGANRIPAGSGGCPPTPPLLCPGPSPRIQKGAAVSGGSEGPASVAAPVRRATDTKSRRGGAGSTALRGHPVWMLVWLSQSLSLILFSVG